MSFLTLIANTTFDLGASIYCLIVIGRKEIEAAIQF